MFYNDVKFVSIESWFTLYTNADLEISLNVYVHIETTP